MFPDLTVSQWVVLLCSVLTVGLVIGALWLCIGTWRTCREIDRLADEVSRVAAETKRIGNG